MINRIAPRLIILTTIFLVFTISIMWATTRDIRIQTQKQYTFFENDLFQQGSLNHKSIISLKRFIEYDTSAKNLKAVIIQLDGFIRAIIGHQNLNLQINKRLLDRLPGNDPLFLKDRINSLIPQLSEIIKWLSGFDEKLNTVKSHKALAHLVRQNKNQFDRFLSILNESLNIHAQVQSVFFLQLKKYNAQTIRTLNYSIYLLLLFIIPIILFILVYLFDQNKSRLALKKINDELEQHVKNRTAKLEAANAKLAEEITVRQQSEEEKSRMAEEWQATFDATNDAIWILDQDQRIQRTNKKAEHLFQRPAGELIGRHCWEIVHGTDQPIPECPNLLAKKSLCRETMELEINDKWFQVTLDPILNAGGSYTAAVHIVSDITERKLAEKMKMQHQKALRQAHKMESIGTLAGGIAHDFNNLLYMITGNAELALDDIPDWNPVHHNLEAIKSAGLRAAGIVRQLLNFSQRTDFELKPIDIVVVTREALKFLRATLPASIEMIKHLPDTKETIFADPIQINQVLINICTNAFQAMEETGGILDIALEKTILTEAAATVYPDIIPGDVIKIIISDTGPGIDPYIIDKIFDPYFTTRAFGKGSGMGLAMVHGIIKNHGGAITVDSRPGKGTTFTILFPAIAEKPVSETNSEDKRHSGMESILFVDDEKSIADMNTRMLKRLGYRVTTRLNPIEALELFAARPDAFDLVITDMTMPQMTGAVLSKKLM